MLVKSLSLPALFGECGILESYSVKNMVEK
jgi:hypothetical protein